MGCASREFIYDGLRFYISDRVYEPAEDTLLLADNLDVHGGDRVLDVGTGCGILAVLAALRASWVLAVDINPYAVRCARVNAERNGVLDKIDFICGSLFDPLREGLRFDLILFNPPYLPLDDRPGDWLDYAWAGGRDGRSVIDRFLSALPRYLEPGGRLLMVQSSLSDIEKTRSALEFWGFTVDIIDEIKSFFEIIVLMRAKRRSPIESGAHSKSLNFKFKLV